MTTYRKYNPEKDVLKEGVTVRFAGREGVIACTTKKYPSPTIYVRWLDGEKTAHWIEPTLYPDLEIAEEPLRISKRLKQELWDQISVAVTDTGDTHVGNKIEEHLLAFIDSLEETE